MRHVIERRLPWFQNHAAKKRLAHAKVAQRKCTPRSKKSHSCRNHKKVRADGHAVRLTRVVDLVLRKTRNYRFYNRGSDPSACEQAIM
jgi:hypothetical protein